MTQYIPDAVTLGFIDVIQQNTTSLIFVISDMRSIGGTLNYEDCPNEEYAGEWMDQAAASGCPVRIYAKPGDKWVVWNYTDNWAP